MIEKDLIGLDQKVYITKLENGLSIYLVPFSDRKNYYIEYVTKFGSVVNKFKVNGKEKKVPFGIAHFLEHKMFEQESGEDTFKFFSKYGSDANASTGYKSTSYIVEGTSNIEENLDYLLTYVNSPYFTDENVEKEKNIIIEEINMYNDEPEGKLYEESSKALFKVHPMRVDIGGTEKSVKSITKEQLYDCYNAFYQHNNMMLFIGGTFEVDKVIEVVKNNKALNKKKEKLNVEVVNANEPLPVNIQYKQIKINNLMIPKLILTIKVSLKEVKQQERYKFSLLCGILLSILYGSSSEFRESMLNQGLMSILSTSKAIIDDFLLIEFMAESKNPKLLADKIIECFENVEITENEVERYKKVTIANSVLNSDKIIPTINMLSEHLIDYGDIIYDKQNIIKNVTLDDVIKVRNNIDIKNSSLVIANSKGN